MWQRLLEKSLFTSIELPAFFQEKCSLSLEYLLIKPSPSPGKNDAVAGELVLDPKPLPRGSAQHF